MVRTDTDADRLRGRVREAVPPFAGALLDARGVTDPDRDTLDDCYRTTLRGCLRLLFVAHAADRDPLPAPTGESLAEIAASVHETRADGTLADDRTVYWDAVADRVRRLDADGLPTVEPGPFTATDGVRLTDAAFGPVLAALFPDRDIEDHPIEDHPTDGADDDRETPGEAPDGRPFLRALATAYAGLLDSELVVEAGEPSLHGGADDRKTSGSYYTRPRFVAHLLDSSLSPALDDHLDRVDRVREARGDRAASAALFDLRLADIAMGAGGFLLAATDRVVAAFDDYLREQPLSGVADRLAALDESAARPVDRGRLLRWLVVRHCVYGVDLDPLAAELARLSLWAETFVRGVGPPALSHGLRTGDSLAGVGTPAEAGEAMDAERAALSAVADDLAALRGSPDGDGGGAGDGVATGPTGEGDRRATVDGRLAPLRARLDIVAAARIDDGVDADAAAAAVADPTTLPAYERARDALVGLDPLHFPAAFPEVFAGDGPAGTGGGGEGTTGFDVLVGNPPWEKAKLERHAFWARYEPGLRGLSQADREAEIDRLERDRPATAARFERERRAQERRAALLTAGPYPGLGASDPDLYVAFAWRFWALLGADGFAGVVLPRPAFVGSAAEAFRRRLLEQGRVRDLTFLVNTGGWVFEALHGQFTVALASFQRSAPAPDETLPVRGPFPDAASYEAGLERPPYEFDAADATGWTDTASFPVLPADPRSGGAFERLADTPRLDRDEPGEWRVRPLTELHGTQDKTREDGTRVIRFDDDPPEDHRPVYKGGSFDIWEPDTGTYYGWADPAVTVDYVQESRERSYRYAGSRSPFAELDAATVEDPDTLRYWGPRLAYREVTNRTNRRTVVPALVPPRVFLNHKAPYFLQPRGDERDEAYLLGVLASIPLDWYARRFVENTVSFYLLNAFPVPRPGRDDPRRRRVVDLAGRLAAVDDRYADWADAVGVEYGPLGADAREERIAELDAVVARLYGLTREHVAVVFGTFHDNWDHEDRLDRVLAHYDEWGDRRGHDGDG